jgi:hypothetical protein
MRRKQAPWAPLMELPAGAVGPLLAWQDAADGTWRAWVSCKPETGARHVPKVAQPGRPACAR